MTRPADSRIEFPRGHFLAPVAMEGRTLVAMPPDVPRYEPHGADSCDCGDCRATYRQGRTLASFNASATCFGWALLSLVALTLAAVLGAGAR